MPMWLYDYLKDYNQRCLKFLLHSCYPSDTLRSKKFQTKLILAFEANSVLSPKNETKIVKITHSVEGTGRNNFKRR